jgi:hypothetical protein
MVRLNCKIIFTNKVTNNQMIFDFVNRVTIETSFENLTQTAHIVLPRKITFQGKEIASGNKQDTLFHRGDKVLIQLGYYPNLTTVFKGYINRISINSPIEIDCDDEMFILKKYVVTYPTKKYVQNYGKTGKELKTPKITSDKITLADLLNNIIPNGITPNPFGGSGTSQIGMFRIENSPAIKALDELKSKFGIVSYFQDDKLQIGFRSDVTRGSIVNFEFEKNIINDENLKYETSEDFPLLINCESININGNSRIIVQAGDKEGTRKDFKFLNVDKDTLTKTANNLLLKWKYTGYKGSFETFGENHCQFGDIARLTSQKYPEKNGDYEIIGVTYDYGVDIGYRQKVQIGIRLNSNDLTKL